MNQDLYVSKVHLLSVPLENDYKNTLYFTSKDTQQSYFQSTKKYTFEDFYYIRKDNVIRVKTHYDTLVSKGVNYLMYQNTAYSNKWFYCFITDIRYINDECTELVIETDVMQTWMFDVNGDDGYIIKPSFVEREHVDDDTLGKHTIPEGLETGDYVCMTQGYSSLSDELCMVLAYSDYNTTTQKYTIKGFNNGGIYSGVAYAPFKLNDDGINQLNDLLSSYDKNAKADGIVSLFMAPKWLFNDEPENDRLTFDYEDDPKEIDYRIPRLTSLDGHEPRNNKLLCYPYNYLNVFNGSNGSAIYQPELFDNSADGWDGVEYLKFKIKGIVTPGCSIRCIPVNYNKIQYNYQYGLNAGKYPICCWVSDSFTNWEMQNAPSMLTAIGSGGASMIAGVTLLGTGVGTGVGAGMVAGGIMTIQNAMVQRAEAKMVPDQVRGNVDGGDIISASGNNKFYFYYMSIKNEYAQIIDKFFDMFGYKVNDVKVPNKAHRSRYWYTKTIDVNIDGNVPNIDMQKIKDCYNRGITFWRNANEIQDYSLPNDIV